jgi:hypothetical protein
MACKNIAITTATIVSLTVSGMAQAVEIRLCEQDIHTYPLTEERGVQSALVQGFAVLNEKNYPVKLTGITFNLKNKQQVLNSSWLQSADISSAAKQSPQISMVAQIFPSQFCNGKMLDGAKLATTEILAPGEALIFMHQPFVWKGARDTVEIIAMTERDGESQSDRISLNFLSSTSKTQILFPIVGRSFVPVAASFHTPHRWAAIEEFSYDIVRLTGSGSTFQGTGEKLSDYAVFGNSVRAVANGNVVAAIGSEVDNVAMLKRAGESDDTYLIRLQQGQMELLARGMASVLGNHVVIDHGNGEYSIYAHLKQGSVVVKPGDKLSTGAIIGQVGSSGNSTEPHLHFQICDDANISTCHPIPASFIGYRLPFELALRSIQSGDVIETVE